MRLATFAFVFGSAVGFQIVSPWSNRRNRVAPLFESSLEDDDAAADDATTTTATAVVVEESSSDLADLAKSDLLETAKSLKDEFGCVLIDSGAQEKLTKVVETLESTAEPPADTSGLIGDWTLLCSTASASIATISTFPGGPGHRVLAPPADDVLASPGCLCAMGGAGLRFGPTKETQEQL